MGRIVAFPLQKNGLKACEFSPNLTLWPVGPFRTQYTIICQTWPTTLVYSEVVRTISMELYEQDFKKAHSIDEQIVSTGQCLPCL